MSSKSLLVGRCGVLSEDVICVISVLWVRASGIVHCQA